MDDRPSITLYSQSGIIEQTWKVDTSFDISSSDEEKSVDCYADMDVSATDHGDAGVILESYTTVSPSSGAETTYAARLFLDSALDGATIRVQDKNTSYSLVDLANYPIKWASIANKPSNRDDSGVYLFKYTSGNTVLTTVLICTNQAGMAGENYTTWYLNNSWSWANAPSGWKNSATKLF